MGLVELGELDLCQSPEALDAVDVDGTEKPLRPRARISERQIRTLVRCFAADLTAPADGSAQRLKPQYREGLNRNTKCTVTCVMNASRATTPATECS
jgi:hypothetical protein